LGQDVDSKKKKKGGLGRSLKRKRKQWQKAVCQGPIQSRKRGAEKRKRKKKKAGEGELTVYSKKKSSKIFSESKTRKRGAKKKKGLKVWASKRRKWVGKLLYPLIAQEPGRKRERGKGGSRCLGNES